MNPVKSSAPADALPLLTHNADRQQDENTDERVSALVISVENFHAHTCHKTGPPLDCDCKHDEDRLSSLTGFHNHAKKVCETYGKHRIDFNHIGKGHTLTTAKIHQKVMGFISGDGPPLRIVHVVTHGMHGLHNDVYMSGVDGFFPAKQQDRYCPPPEAHACDVGSVIRNVVHNADRSDNAPGVLLVLDMCSGRHLLDLAEQLVPREQKNPVWIITAVSPTESTYDALLTQAISECLLDQSWMKTALETTKPFITWPALGESLKSKLKEKARGHFANPEMAPEAVLTRTDRNPTVQFFKNLAFEDKASSAYGAAAESLDRSLQRFPDEIQALIDTSHFVGRAQGKAVNGESRLPVIGRQDKMIYIKKWMNNPPDAASQDADHRLLVTGGRGTGKSTLLALAVCSAHPGLRTETRALWGAKGTQYMGKELPWLVAVHARQLDVSQVQAGIISQLGYLLRENKKEKSVKALESREDLVKLIAALKDSGCDVVIVIDALDESLECRQITQLLLDLQNGPQYRQPGAPPLCRILVGARNQDDNVAVDRALKLFSAKTVDLNKVNLDKLENQIECFFEAHSENLVTDAANDLADQVVTQATKLALTASSEYRDDERTSVGSEVSWGAFLIANVLLRHFLNHPVDSEDSLKNLAELSVSPTSLLALELNGLSQDDEATMRVAFIILAFAKGEGLPLTDWQTAVEHIRRQQDLSFSCANWLSELIGFKYYFRVVAVQGMLRYRFFHEGFSEYWQSQLLQHKKGSHYGQNLAD